MTPARYFFHDLQCRSGLGDRLLDLWAAATIARLHDPARVLAVRWHPGHRFSSFTGDYDPAAFSVAGCMLVDTPPPGAAALPGVFSHVAMNDRGLLPLAGDVWQVVLRTGMIWGNSSPERLHADLPFYSLDPAITLERVIGTFSVVARGTAPSPQIWQAAPPGIDTCVGVHVRLGDKLVPKETAVDMSEITWRDLERKALAYLDVCIADRRPLFVCSDDPGYLAALTGHLRSKGAAVVAAPPAQAPSSMPGSRALVDFFALSRCRTIVQMTKYSTFSLAAALIGGAPLVNFYGEGAGPGHRLDIWRSALAAATSHAPVRPS
jgi:hypothetical protein